VASAGRYPSKSKGIFRMAPDRGICPIASPAHFWIGLASLPFAGHPACVISRHPIRVTCEASWMSKHIQHVTDDTFESEVLQAPVPVLVDYWAEWCGPCKMIAPILDEVAEEYEGRLKIAKLNIDENQSTPPKYGIRGIPTLMLFKNGNIEATKVGAVSKSQLTAFIDSNI